MLYDAHCHLDAASPDDLAAARAAGVEGWLCAGYDSARWARQPIMEGVWQAYGLHPWAVTPEVEYLEELRARLATAVAVGEIGLDRARRTHWATQQKAFRDQLALARELDLPVILHVVRAHGTALEILRADGVPGGMVHGFHGPAELLDAWLELGFYLSLGEASPPFPEIPLDRVLLESDAPGGGQLENVPLTLARVAQARGLTPGQLAEATAANLRRLLRR